MLPATDYQILTTTPGWNIIRAGGYVAASGRPPAGRRRDQPRGLGTPRRALIELGIGLWQRDAGSRRYAHTPRERGKPGGVIACALARRANKIAFAMVRDQTPFDPTRWS